MKQFILSGIFLSFMVSACAGVDSSALNYDSLSAKVNAGRLSYQTLSIHAHMVWSDDNSEQDFQASIRMVKDSLIWISLSGAMGIEGARLLITRDSFRIINKSANEYEAHDFNYVRNWLLFPVSFSMLQQLFSGGQFDIGEPAAHGTGSEQNIPLLYSETNKLREKVWVDSLNYTIQKIVLKDKLVNQEMTVIFDDYRKEGTKSFSYNRDIEVRRDSITTKLTINISRLRWNEELTFPFEISDKYKRIENDPNR